MSDGYGVTPISEVPVQHELIDASFKGLPLGRALTLDDIGRQGWNILAGDTGTPVAALKRSAVESNIETMRRFCAGSGLSLAPHAKTAMSPQLIEWQLNAGAWAMTAAVPFHVQLLWSFGIERVLLANELVDEPALRWAARELATHENRELLCYVDSLEGVRLAERAFAAAGGARPLSVLVELGYATGRTGVRSQSELIVVAEAVRAAPHLALVGVAGYEGTIGGDRSSATLRRVDAFLSEVSHAATELRARGLFDDSHEPIVTAGGSVFFDRVAEILGPLQDNGMRVVLRSGCYVTHDRGLYDALTPTVTPEWTLPAFESAMEIWARVVSRPEANLALLNAGRRDVSFDAGLPSPIAAVTPGGVAVDVTGSSITALSDQHAFLTLAANSSLAVGDLVGLGISHPCTALDRWRHLMLVDDDYTVVGGIRTYF